MSSAGPLKTTVTPPESRPRLRQGQMAQFMVLANGLILTLVAYMILSIFIQQLAGEQHRRAADETRQIISTNVITLEHAIRSVSTILSMSTAAADKGAREKIIYAIPHLEKFENVYHLLKDSAGSWKMEELSRAKSAAAAKSPAYVKGLSEYVVLKGWGGARGTVVTTDMPGGDYVVEYTDPVIKGRPVVFIHALNPELPGEGAVVGVARVTDVISKSWIDARPDIVRIVMREGETGRPVFLMDRNLESLDKSEPVLSGQGSRISFGNSEWVMMLDMGQGREMAFLQATPLLMALFGLVLTLVGTLYVRNNQNQSYRLVAMNRALAQKNLEMNTEILERERLNDHLRNAEQEYRSIIDSVRDIIFQVSTQGEITFLNKTWQAITGHKNEKSLDHDFFSFLHPQDQKSMRHAFDQMVRGQKYNHSATVRLRLSDGSHRSFDMSLSMIRQDEDKVLKIVGVMTDVEERIRAERDLSESEKKFKEIVENSVGGIYQVTPEGRFISANPAMARILGYQSVESLMIDKRHAHDLVYGTSSERQKLLRQLVDEGSLKNFESQVITSDNRRIWVSHNARVVRDPEGAIIYYEGSFEDITKRKEAEIKLRDEKIRSDMASRAKSEFLANMSHELRTPLNSIIGFSEVIRDQVLGPVGTDQYLEYARDINSSGHKLLTIINDLLDVARIEAGERHLNESIVNLEKLIRLTIDMVSAKAAAGQVKISNMTMGKVPRIIAEELAMKQIFLNLLSNAIKFTPEGGQVTVSHDIDQEGHLMLSISDTGVGLTEEEIKKAMSPFGQIDSAHSRTGSGTGLGLTLVNSLVALHGGRFEIFSQKGIGTTVTVVMPVQRLYKDDKGEGRALSSGNPASLHPPADRIQ